MKLDELLEWARGLSADQLAVAAVVANGRQGSELDVYRILSRWEELDPTPWATERWARLGQGYAWVHVFLARADPSDPEDDDPTGWHYQIDDDRTVAVDKWQGPFASGEEARRAADNELRERWLLTEIDSDELKELMSMNEKT